MSNINSHLLSKAFFTLYSPQQKQKTEIYNSSNSLSPKKCAYPEKSSCWSLRPLLSLITCHRHMALSAIGNTDRIIMSTEPTTELKRKHQLSWR